MEEVSIIIIIIIIIITLWVLRIVSNYETNIGSKIVINLLGSRIP
jgi:hypothetical protein